MSPSSLRRCTSCGELVAKTWLGVAAHVRTGAITCHAKDEREPIYAEYGVRVGPVVGKPRGRPPRTEFGKLSAETGIAWQVLYQRHRRGDRGERLTRPVRRYVA